MQKNDKSQVRIDMYPGFNTEEQESQGRISLDIGQLSLNSHDEDEYVLPVYLAQIKQSYRGEDYQQVIILSKEAISIYEEAIKSSTIQSNKNNFNLDISKIRAVLANTFIHLFLNQGENHYLDQAKKCLLYQYEAIETPYKKGQRLNNLGLCQMLKQRYKNAFKYYSQAFNLYQESEQLNLYGLLKNISIVYKQLLMHRQALKCYEYIFQCMDRKNKYSFGQYVSFVISSLQCINQLENNRLHHSYYLRAKCLLDKIDKEREDQYYNRAKIRLEMIKYGIFYGIDNKSITKLQIQELYNDISSLDIDQRQIKLIKGQCCYFYRQLFRYNNWHQYRQISKLATYFFKQSRKN